MTELETIKTITIRLSVPSYFRQLGRLVRAQAGKEENERPDRQNKRDRKKSL